MEKKFDKTMTWGRCHACMTISNTWSLKWTDKEGKQVISNNLHCRPCRDSIRKALMKLGYTHITVNKWDR